MPTVIVNALGWLLGHPSNISNTDARDVGIQIMGYLLSIMNWLNELTQHEEDAFKIAQPDFMDGANGLGNTAYVNAHAWSHLLWHVLPNSLAWLDGKTHEWVDAKYDDPINDLQISVEGLQDSLAYLYHWRDTVLIPFMLGWTRWYKWFTGWPSDALRTVRDWKTRPGAFTDFALPNVARPLANYLDERSHTQLRDYWLSVLVKSAPADGEQ